MALPFYPLPFYLAVGFSSYLQLRPWVTFMYPYTEMAYLKVSIAILVGTPPVIYLITYTLTVRLSPKVLQQ